MSLETEMFDQSVNSMARSGRIVKEALTPTATQVVDIVVFRAMRNPHNPLRPLMRNWYNKARQREQERMNRPLLLSLA